MDVTALRIAVLYADVAGSTRLYEDHGDDVAHAEVGKCVEILSQVTRDLAGRVVKTIGDEVMCVFVDPAKAATAASEMQTRLRDASEAGRFATGTLRVKIGWHYGMAEQRGNDVAGLAPVTAQQIIKLAKADEVLTSGDTLEVLPKGLKAGARFIDRVEAEAWSGHLDVYEVPWDDEAELTEMAGPVTTGGLRHHALLLEHGGRRAVSDASHPHLVLGRSDECDLSVHGPFTSRKHTFVEFRHDRFHLRDNSTNGTVVEPEDGELVRLHREEIALVGHGRICLGSLPEEAPEAVVSYRCE